MFNQQMVKGNCELELECTYATILMQNYIPKTQTKNQEGVYNVNKYDKLTGEKLGNIDLGKYFIQMGRLMYTDAEAKQVTCHLINRDMFGIACLCV